MIDDGGGRRMMREREVEEIPREQCDDCIGGKSLLPPPPPPLRFLEPRGIVKSRRRFSDPFAHPVSCGGILFEKSCFKNRVLRISIKLSLSISLFIILLRRPAG